LEKAKTKGIALYGNWSITDMWRVALRVEQIKDDEYAAGLGQGADDKVQAATLTLGFMPSENAEIRLEARQDKASEAVFTVDDAAEEKQRQFAIEALYKF
jgi:hypothetical protein